MSRIPRALGYLALGLGLISVAAGVRHGVDRGIDLLPYLRGAKLWLNHGLSPYEVDLPTGFVYLPQAALLFAPLAPLPDEVARAAWAAINVGLLAVALVLLARLSDTWRNVTGPGTPAPLGALPLAAAVLGWAAIRVTIGNGQIGLLALACLLGAVWLERRGRPWTAGLLLGLALTKWTMGLPFLAYFAVRRRGGTVVLVALACIVVGYVVFGLRLDQGPVEVLYDYAWAIKAHAGVKHAFLRTTDLTAAGTAVGVWLGSDLGGLLGHALVAGALMVALTWAAWRCARVATREAWGLLLGVCAVVTLVALPHLHYDELLLAVPVAALLTWTRDEGRRLARALGWGACALLWLDVPGTAWKLAGRPDPIDGGVVELLYVGFDRLWLAGLLVGLLWLVAALPRSPAMRPALAEPAMPTGAPPSPAS